MKAIHTRSGAIQFGLLLTFWLILSGHYDIFHTLMGVLSSLLIVTMFYKLQETIREKHRYHFRPLKFTFHYIPYMLWQIILAALTVTKAAFSPKRIEPTLFRFKTNLPTEVSRVILANSITLTPGTITIDVDQDEFLVHSLMSKSFEGLKDDSMPQMVSSLYKESEGPMIYSLRKE